MKIEILDRVWREISFNSSRANIENFDFEGVHFDSEGVGDGVYCCFT